MVLNIFGRSGAGIRSGDDWLSEAGNVANRVGGG